MATSSFQKRYVVESKNVDNFVNNMVQKVSPTLKKNFTSKYVAEKDIKDKLLKALK